MYLESKDRRDELLVGAPPEGLDELAFVLNEVILAYLPPIPNTDDYLGVVGALEAVKLEFYRRGFGPLNEQRAALNGDNGYGDLPQNRG